MARKLFCQICPLTYRISTYKVVAPQLDRKS